MSVIDNFTSCIILWVTGPGISPSPPERLTTRRRPTSREGDVERRGYPSGYSVGSTTEDKELGTGSRPNGEGDELRWVMGPRVTPLSPRTETSGGCADYSPPQKKVYYFSLNIFVLILLFIFLYIKETSECMNKSPFTKLRG